MDEIERLAKFDEIFRITTSLVCFDPVEPARCWWFRVGPLMLRPRQRKMGEMTVKVTPSIGMRADMNRPLQEALRDLLLLQ